MPAYLLVQTELDDPEAFEEYRRRAPDLIARFGGEYLVRGGRFEHLEGDAPRSRIVVLRFPSMEAAKAWYDCPEYEELKRIRATCARSNIVLVEGLA
jgi:uncharacterized protein (DUF1330 family)